MKLRVCSDASSRASCGSKPTHEARITAIGHLAHQVLHERVTARHGSWRQFACRDENQRIEHFFV
jgi:hypothetical protein